MGELNIEPDVYLDLTISELQIKADGYFHRLERLWEHTRFLGAYLHTELSGKVIEPEKLHPMIFDIIEPEKEAEKEEPMTKEEVEKFTKKWLK